MAFRMRQATINMTRDPPQTEGHKIAQEIDLEPVKLKNYGGHFVYQPSRISSEAIEYTQTKSMDEYLQNYKYEVMLQKPKYEKEELVFDKATNRWKLVKEENY